MEDIKSVSLATWIGLITGLMYWGGASYLAGLQYALDINVFVLLDIADILLLPFVDILIVYILMTILLLAVLPRIGSDKHEFIQKTVFNLSKRVKLSALTVLLLILIFSVILFGFELLFYSLIGGLIGYVATSIIIFLVIPLLSFKIFSNEYVIRNFILLFFLLVTLITPLILGIREGEKIAKYGTHESITMVVNNTVFQGEIVFETHKYFIIDQYDFDDIRAESRDSFKNLHSYIAKEKVQFYVKDEYKGLPVKEFLEIIWKERWQSDE